MTAPQQDSADESRGHKLATHLILLVAACLLPLLLFAALLLIQHADREYETAERRVRNWAYTLTESLDRELERMRAAAEVLSTSSTLTSGNLKEFHAEAAQVRDLLSTNVVLRDLTKQQLVNTRLPWGAALPKNSADVDDLVVATRRAQISGLFTGGVLQRPMLIVVVPVLRDGVVAYLLSLTLSTERLSAVIGNGLIPTEWSVALIDGDGTLLAKSPKTEAVIGSKYPRPEVMALSNEPEGVARVLETDSGPVLRAYNRSKLSNWIVQVEAPKEAIVAAGRQSLAILLIGGLVFLLGGVGAAILLGRRLTGPFTQLAEAAVALGSNRPVAAVTPGISELDIVARSFDKAAHLIRERNSALQASEQNLRNSQERLQLAAQVGRFGTFDWDLAEDTHIWSSETYRIFGMPVGSAVASSAITGMLHPDDRGRVERFFASKRKWPGSDEATIEYRIIWPNGDIRWVNASIQAIFEKAGDTYLAIRLIGAIQDVTQQHSAADILRFERDRAQLYFETAGVMLLVIGADRRVKMINRKGAAILGLSADAIIGRDWFTNFIPERFRQQLGGLLDGLIHRRENPQIDFYENPVLCADSTERLISWRNAIFRDEYGNVTAILSSGEDITDRRAAETALRRNEERYRELQSELLHISRLTDMGQMAAAIAHELNQPLAAVANYVGGCRLLLDAERSDTSQLRYAIGMAEHQALQAGKIVRRLRNFIAKGEGERRMENVEGVIADALALALVGADQKGISIHTEIGTGLSVIMDKIQIQQVLVNLIRNAAEAMTASESKMLTVGVRAADDALEFRVSDTGAGLAPQIAARLFEPFSSTKATGMGIGLSVCRAIVEAHGGRIWAEPNQPCGATFLFTIPTGRQGSLQNG